MKAPIALCVFLFSLASWAKQSDFPYQFSDVRSTLIQAPEAKTVAEALERLKQQPKFGDLFRNYTLAHDSKSLQGATPLNPRAVLFGATGHLILTFNGHKNQKGGYALETAEFNPEFKKLSMREIIFKSELPKSITDILPENRLQFAKADQLKKALSLSPQDIEFENSSFAITKANPQKCLTCHSLSPAHPREATYVWTGYKTWNGFYGSDDDQYKKNPTEWTNLSVFKKLSLDKDGPRSNSRYATLEEFITSPKMESEAYYAPFGFRPNLRLTMLVGSHQGQINARVLEPEFARTDTDSFIEAFCSNGSTDAHEKILQTLHLPNMLLDSTPYYNAAEESWISGTDLDRYVLSEAIKRRFTALYPEFSLFLADSQRDNKDVFLTKHIKELEQIQIDSSLKEDWTRFFNYLGPNVAPYRGTPHRDRLTSSSFYVKVCKRYQEILLQRYGPDIPSYD